MILRQVFSVSSTAAVLTHTAGGPGDSRLAPPPAWTATYGSLSGQLWFPHPQQPIQLPHRRLLGLRV